MRTAAAWDLITHHNFVSDVCLLSSLEVLSFFPLRFPLLLLHVDRCRSREERTRREEDSFQVCGREGRLTRKSFQMKSSHTFWRRLSKLVCTSGFLSCTARLICEPQDCVRAG